MANNRNRLLFLTAASLICLGYVAKPVKAIEIKCKGMDVKITEDQVMNVKECLTSAGVTKVMELSPETAGCFSRCVMEKKELIDGNGKPHKENINKLIDASMPEAIVGEWKGEMEKCLDKEGQMIKPSAEDPKCQSYLPLTMCTHGAFMKVCMSS